MPSALAVLASVTHTSFAWEVACNYMLCAKRCVA